MLLFPGEISRSEMAGGRSDRLEVFFILTGIARLLSKKAVIIHILKDNNKKTT